MILGIDLDNTLALFDHLFHTLARERGLIPAGLPATKRAVRAAVRALPGGELRWRELQGAAYGPRMAEAEPAPGAAEVMAALAERGALLHVVSHKTEFSPYDPTHTDLRRAALAWLEAQGLRPAGGRVHFEATRAAKLERIRELGCSAFVDDLEELLLDPGFPAGVVKLLYDPAGEVHAPGLECFGDWRAIGVRLSAEAGQ